MVFDSNCRPSWFLHLPDLRGPFKCSASPVFSLRLLRQDLTPASEFGAASVSYSLLTPRLGPSSVLRDRPTEIMSFIQTPEPFGTELPLIIFSGPNLIADRLRPLLPPKKDVRLRIPRRYSLSQPTPPFTAHAEILQFQSSNAQHYQNIINRRIKISQHSIRTGDTQGSSQSLTQYIQLFIIIIATHYITQFFNVFPNLCNNPYKYRFFRISKK